MAFGKKPIVCKLVDLGEARSMYTQTNALTDKNRTAAVHSGSLAIMVPELVIEELSIVSAGIYELKRRMGSFNDILYNTKSRSVLSISK